MSKKSSWDKVDSFIAITGVLMIAAAVLLTLHSGINKPKEKKTHIDTSIVRLHDVETGRFFCSGVVIADHLILTAAHCVVREGFFGIGVEVVRKVEIRAANGVSLGIYADLLNANPRQDVALLDGNFSLFDKKEVEINPNKLEQSFLHSKHLRACGYPDAGSLACSAVSNVSHMNFGFTADGFLYPGMSGGPVIDEETGKVIAVNTAVIESKIYLSPTVELFNQLGL